MPPVRFCLRLLPNHQSRTLTFFYFFSFHICMLLLFCFLQLQYAVSLPQIIEYFLHLKSGIIDEPYHVIGMIHLAVSVAMAVK